MTREPGDLPDAVSPLRGRGVQRDRGSSSRDDIGRGARAGDKPAIALSCHWRVQPFVV